MASPDYRTISVSLPVVLVEKIEKIAKDESKTTSELLREALGSYQEQQLRKALRDSQEEFRRNNPMNYTEADVERLIDEYRAEQVALSVQSE
jgi:Arc/MetJ-type ribon-helix-helix transcriptional regulator